MDINSRLEQLIENIKQLIIVCYPKKKFRIGYLTIFSQNQDDYTSLVDLLSKLGDKSAANNGVKFHLREPKKILGENIVNIRVRMPDIHRPELGCADLIFAVKDYENLRNEALTKGLDIILRKDYEMIELATRDINAYAYLVHNF